MDVCWSCDEGVFVVDSDSGGRVCNSCGLLESSIDYQDGAPTLDGQPTSNFHFVGDLGYRERKLYHARTVLQGVASRLRLSPSHAAEALALASDATDAALGGGDWFRVFSAACCFIVARRHRLRVSFAEAADAAGFGCDAREVGRMVDRVVRHLELPPMPELDAVGVLESAFESCPSLSGIEPEKAKEMIGQGRFLLQCATKWFLTTGRHPLPMIVAILAFVAKVNKVEVPIDELAKDLYATVSTSNLRLKELMETLISVARSSLPWGNDVTLKNIVQNTPLLLKIMHRKSNSNSNSESSDGTGFNFLNSFSNNSENEKNYFEGSHERGISLDDLKNIKLSGERIASVSKKVLERISYLKKMGEIDKYQGNKRRGGELGMEMWNTSEGIWDSDEGLTLEEMVRRDVGYDALPPSFISGIEKRNHIKGKIKAAKTRIDAIMKPQSEVDQGLKLPMEEEEEEGACLVQLVDRKLKRKRKCKIVGLDWEDCIIELLLLHNISEDEIAKGHYNRLLDLYVFNSFSK